MKESAKVAKGRKYTTDGLFMSTESYEVNIQKAIASRQQPSRKVDVEFYQKVFQDFPKKYATTIKYLLPPHDAKEREGK